MELSFTVDVSSIERAFGSIRRRVNDLTPAHQEIGRDVLEPMVLSNFDNSGGAESWKPLRPSTLARRARSPIGLAGSKPLIWSKALYRSITSAPTSDYVDVGTPMIKGRTLFFGGTGWGGSEIPARNPFAWRVGDVQKIQRVYLRHIFGIVVQ